MTLSDIYSSLLFFSESLNYESPKTPRDDSPIPPSPEPLTPIIVKRKYGSATYR